GRKRHIAVDTLGLPIECQVTPASVQDRDALAPVLGAVHRKSPWVTMSFVDSGYQGDEAQRAAYEASRITITVVKRTDTTVKGFIVLPKRWVVEKEPWAGSTARDACQRISRRQSNPHSHGSNWPSLSSLCEGLRGKTRPPEFRVGLSARHRRQDHRQRRRLHPCSQRQPGNLARGCGALRRRAKGQQFQRRDHNAA